MRITITPDARPGEAVTLIDGSWLNLTWLRGEIRGLVKDGLSGWFDSLSPRVSDSDVVAIPQQDFSYWPSRVTLAHRVLTVRGVHRADRGHGGSSLQVAEFRDWLAALVGEAVEVLVEDQSGPRTVTGFVSAQIPLTGRDLSTTEFSIIITCPDGYKYVSPTDFAVAEGSAVVEQTGTGRTFPILICRGHTTYLVVSDPDGNRVSWRGDTTGLVWDLQDGLPLNADGVEVGETLDLDPLRLPRGQTKLAVSTDGALTIRVRNGFK